MRLRLPVVWTVAALLSCGGAERAALPPAEPPPAPPAVAASPAPAPPAEPPLAAYWDHDRIQPILDKTLTVRLDVALDGLSPGEMRAAALLLEVGAIFQTLHERMRHVEALVTRARLRALRESPAVDRKRVDGLLTLYDLFDGPIAVTLDNERQPFAPVQASPPGRAVYPWGIERKELESFLAASPESKDEILAVRSVVRRRGDSLLVADQAALDRHPVLAGLFPGLRERLGADGPALVAVPYSVAYADEMVKAHGLLLQASVAVAADDPDLSRYFALRARDLLTSDYEAGDAAWVRGSFRNLNAQIGAYETYDDELMGVKAFYSLSLLVRDRTRGGELATVTRGLQAIEEKLPYESKKRVREDIPIGVYQVVADFGQARGTNTASILPNEDHIARKYGRTILLRHSILTHPELFASARASYQAALAPAHHADLALEGNLDRTLWHEIGHYLGPDRTHDGRTFDQALADTSSLFEELKADLIALHATSILERDRRYDGRRSRAVYASGILRTLNKVKPRRDQAYQTMQLMQLNHFLEQRLVRFDAQTRVLHVDWARFPAAVRSMLTEVLTLQEKGDVVAARAYVDRLTTWKDELHGALAEAMRKTETHRFRRVDYGAHQAAAR